MATAVINNTNSTFQKVEPNTNNNTNSTFQKMEPNISNVKTPPTTNTNTNANVNGSGTKRKIPNTLIIYLKTRIANYYKINFDPSMLVPKINSHTVYIDPLVKYDWKAIRNLPSDAPKELLLTQFFLPNQFDSMINRILSGFFSMQKTRTLEEAKAEGVIDNNIQITLDTLFKRNNVLFINNRPYTLVGNRWNKGDWEIDTKPVEKLITPFTPLKGDELESAENELNDLGAGVRMGNAAAAGIKAQNVDTKTVPTGPLPDTPEAMAEEEKKKQIMKPADVKLSAQIPESTYSLLKDGLIKNDPIDYTPLSRQMKVSDPLTFIFLIDEPQLIEFIETQQPPEQKQKSVDVYKQFTEAKSALINATDLFFDLIMIDFGVMKKEFDTLMDEVDDYIGQLQPKTTTSTSTVKPVDYNLVKNKVAEMNVKRKEFMRSLLDLSNALLDIFQKQQVYFASLVALLEFIKTNYKQIIGYTRKSEPTLALECINLDIQIYSSLNEKNLQRDNQLKKRGRQMPVAILPGITEYANVYFKTIQDFKQKHNEWFSTVFMTKYSSGSGNNSSVNLSAEVDKYKANPCLVKVEHDQYSVYMFIIMLYAFMNQSDLWHVYSGPISNFITKIQQNAETKISETDVKNTDYQTYLSTVKDAMSEDEILQKIKADQKNLGQTKSQGKEEQKYIEITEHKIESYEYITLYINLLELQCTREHCVYVSDLNVNQIYIEIADNSDKYYEDIKGCFTTTLQSVTLPNALMWKTTDISTPAGIDKRIKSNDTLLTLYISKKKSIKLSITNLEEYCKEKVGKLLDPVIDANGIEQQCDILVSKDPNQFLKIPPYVPRVQKWILNELKDYDEPTTSQLNYRLKAQIKKDKAAGYKFKDNCQDLIALKPDADLSSVDPVNYNTIYSVIKMLNDSTKTTSETVTKVLDQFQ